MKDNLERVLERDGKLSELDSRAGEDSTTEVSACVSISTDFIICHLKLICTYVNVLTISCFTCL
jgi:hypothetical protein